MLLTLGNAASAFSNLLGCKSKIICATHSPCEQRTFHWLQKTVRIAKWQNVQLAMQFVVTKRKSHDNNDFREQVMAQRHEKKGMKGSSLVPFPGDKMSTKSIL